MTKLNIKVVNGKRTINLIQPKEHRRSKVILSMREMGTIAPKQVRHIFETFDVSVCSLLSSP